MRFSFFCSLVRYLRSVAVDNGLHSLVGSVKGYTTVTARSLLEALYKIQVQGIDSLTSSCSGGQSVCEGSVEKNTSPVCVLSTSSTAPQHGSVAWWDLRYLFSQESLDVTLKTTVSEPRSDEPS